VAFWQPIALEGGFNLDIPIETAAELYQEISRRGLDLCLKNGRDNALLLELANRIGCEDLNIQNFLDQSDLSAQDFMAIFIDIAQPFARMFAEIWDYLSTYAAYRSSESIAVRFGFPDSKNPSVITLEQFRRHVETIRQTILTVHLWPDKAIYSLYELYRILLQEVGSGVGRHKYQEGQAFTLPKVASAGHPFDEIAIRIQRLFQKNIDAFAEKGRSAIEGISFRYDTGMEEGSHPGFPTRRLTADLLPFWQRVFEKYGHIAEKTKSKALEYYRKNTALLLQARKGIGTERFIEALNIIDLPFWRHRWHIYEVWSTVAVLRTLQEYGPSLRVCGNFVPIDGYEPSTIADLEVEGFSNACITVQVQTPYVAGKRKAIKPDLRVCFSERLEPKATAAIVEFKQRKRLSRKEILEISKAYLGGSPKCGGVILVNYDAVPPDMLLHPWASLVGELHPCNQDAVDAFQSALLRALENISFRPVKKKTVVLLDVSGSMAGQYDNGSIQDALRRLLCLTKVSVFTFNDGLISGHRMGANTSTSLKTTGGTGLGKALDDLEKTFGVPDKLLIVTDGGYICPDGRLKQIHFVKECMPEDIENNMQWLLTRIDR
jgi:hypothetical protein